MPTYDEKLNISYYQKNDLTGLLKPVPRNVHKGEKGCVLIFGGSWNYRGAPILAALGALRAGAGAVVLAIPDFMVDMASAVLPEAIFAPVSTLNNMIEAESVECSFAQWRDRCDSVIFGPGIGRDKSLQPITERLWSNCDKPLLLDADALYFYALIKNRLGGRGDAVITPHSGEAGAILGITPGEVNKRRFDSAQKLTDKAGTAVLKGMDTVVAQRDGIRIIKEGAPSLAVPGSGDVLSGVIGAFMAVGMPPFDAATAGALLHAAAGSSLDAKKGTRGILAREIADELPLAFG